MSLSFFGEKFTAKSGIVTLMEDLGDIPASRPDIVSMGGGNPARIPQVADFLRERLIELLSNEDRFHAMVGQYQSPQGAPDLRRRIAAYFQRTFGWPVTEANIAITNGGQSAFFMLANMLAGRYHDGSSKQLLFPLVPEYLGYTDAGLSEPFFQAVRPTIELQNDHFFKYRVDFDALEINSQVAGICVSRPTNPTGNVHTDEEIRHLDELAGKHDIPLIIDGAYGLPFPNIVFSEAKPFWSKNTLLMLSLSKLGLPGLRSGILVGSEQLIDGFASANAVINLASGNLGAYLLADLLDSGEMDRLARDCIKPFYKGRVEQALALFKAGFDDSIPYHIHTPEGALFLWLWFEGLPVDTLKLYEDLKQLGVLIVPGNACFPGLSESWRHTRECVRISYAQDQDALVKGIGIITDEINRLYRQGS